MSISTTGLTQLLIALTILLVVAHLLGHVFALLRQPVVIGEIIGGLLVGPTLFGAISPRAQAALFPATGVVGTGLGVVYELGLLMLMFLSGREMRTRRDPGSGRLVAGMAVAGIVLPFGVALLVAGFLDPRPWIGPHGSGLTFLLVFGIGIAVTSIPVISRILLDLGIMHTPFARVVLSVAVCEDIFLYVALSVVIGFAQGQSNTVSGLSALLPSRSSGFLGAYYVVVSLVYFAIFLPLGHRLFGALSASRANLVEKSSPTAFRITFLLVMVLLCFVLNINPVFGALLAGMAVARADERRADQADRDRADHAWTVIKKFSLAFFVPLYFAGVGIQLDLVRHFNVLFFLAVLLLACLAKLVSVWLGARLAGEPSRSAVDFAVALNARGGPGIVLATVTLAAGVINENFFSILVVLSIVTSQLAGLWLQHVYMRRTTAKQPGGTHADHAPAQRIQPVPGAGPQPDAGTP